MGIKKRSFENKGGWVNRICLFRQNKFLDKTAFYSFFEQSIKNSKRIKKIIFKIFFEWKAKGLIIGLKK